MNRAAHARIQQGRRVATMHAAQRVVVPRIRRALIWGLFIVRKKCSM
jgi:hypothetical protein